MNIHSWILLHCVNSELELWISLSLNTSNYPQWAKILCLSSQKIPLQFSWVYQWLSFSGKFTLKAAAYFLFSHSLPLFVLLRVHTIADNTIFSRSSSLHATKKYWSFWLHLHGHVALGQLISDRMCQAIRRRRYCRCRAVCPSSQD